MRIGLDFDNTIVCYNQTIKLLSEKRFELPEELPRTKTAVRDFLRAQGRNAEWTSFQGELYGPGMKYAQAYEGSIETMKHLVDENHELIIISHRSRRPYAGPPHDLHEAARKWVEERLRSIGLFNGEDAEVNFLETREEKVSCIAELGCEAFVDDLPEVLQATHFPSQTVGILFDPDGLGSATSRCLKIRAWSELNDVLQALV